MALTHIMTEDANDFSFTSAANLYGDWLKYGVPTLIFLGNSSLGGQMLLP